MKQEFKISIKLFAFIMAMIMLIVSLPVYAFADLISNEAEDASDSKAVEATKDVVVLGEEESLREESIKHFKLSNGTTKAVIYSHPVHYKDENGNWVDIDNALTLNGNEYTTKNKTEIKLANKSGSNGLVSIKDGEYKIDFTPLDTSKVRVEIENPQENNSRKFEDVSKLNNLVSKAIYKNIYNGIDIEYILVGNNLKENIIVNEKQDSYTYTFELKLNKLSAELKDGAIILSDYDSGEQRYKIPAPYMYDANGVYSEDVEYSLTQESKWKYTFTVAANKEWINSEERDFPVTIDPMIVTNVADEDTYVMNGSSNNSDLNTMIIGSFFGGEVLGFVKFNDILEASNQRVLVDARLSMYLNAVYNSSNLEFYIGIHECTRAWTNDSSFSHGTAEQYYSSSIESSLKITGAGAYDWDITELYKKWQNISNSNFGLCVKAVNLPYDSGTYAGIVTRDHTASYMAPRMELTYVDLLGVQDYYAYASTTLGTTGESYINLYNGSLTYINKLTSVSVGNLTYDINMVYNSIEKCWKPSFAESITTLDYDARNDAEEATDGESSYDNIYLWQDPDGTTHAFTPYLQKNTWGEYVPYVENADGTLTEVQNPTVFYPEDDIDYVLEKISNGDFILKNYDGTQKYFDSEGNLLKICDDQGNVLFLSYENGNVSCIDYVTVENIQIPQVEFTYNTDSELLTVHNFVTDLEVSLIWNNNVLTAIEYDDTDNTKDNTINIFYPENSIAIESIEDELESKYIQYTFNEDGAVSSVQEYNDNNILQSQYDMAYNLDNTVCTDSGANLSSSADNVREKYVFDEKGRKITLSESEGNSSTFTIIDSWTYNDDILPDDVYYTVSYSSNINKELDVVGNETSIVGYNMNTNQMNFLNLASFASLVRDSNNLLSIDESNATEELVSNLDNIEVASSLPDEHGREPVSNTEQVPYSAICFIRTRFNGQNRGATGFLIGPNLMLTVGHNLYDDKTNDDVVNPTFVESITVFPGGETTENSVSSSFGVAYVESWFIQMQYYESVSQGTEAFYDYDWGICVLDRDIGYETGWLDIGITSSDIINETVSVIGYPSDLWYDMYVSEGDVRAITDYTIVHLAYSINGNSGSPLFIKDDSSYTVQGILSSTTRIKQNGVVIDEYYEAIKINVFIYTIAMNMIANE